MQGTPEERALFSQLVSDDSISDMERRKSARDLGVVLATLYATLRVEGVPEHVATNIVRASCVAGFTRSN